MQLKKPVLLIALLSLFFCLLTGCAGKKTLEETQCVLTKAENPKLNFGQDIYGRQFIYDFAVLPTGDVLLLDTAADAVFAYSANGRLKASYSAANAYRLAGGEKGEYYLLDGATSEIRTIKNGVVANRCKLDTSCGIDNVSRISRIDCVKEGMLYVQTDFQTVQLLNVSGNKTTQVGTAQTGNLMDGGGYYTAELRAIHSTTENGVVITIYDEDGQKIARFQVRTLQKDATLWGVTILGEAPGGGYYARAFELLPDDTVVQTFFLIDPNAGTIIEYHTDLNGQDLIRGDGTLYAMHYGANELAIKPLASWLVSTDEISHFEFTCCELRKGSNFVDHKWLDASFRPIVC